MDKSVEKGMDEVRDLIKTHIRESNSRYMLDVRCHRIAEKGIIKAVSSAREEIYKWSEEWFDNKRKNNDMWRSNQDELTSMFLDEFEKRFLKEAKR